MPARPYHGRVTGGVRKASTRMGRLARDALAGLLDQRTPFGRLALTHVLLMAGDTMVTISLAGSLFFSISPDAAKSKVLLYLLLTMAPFAVVAPFLGPLIDRSRGARRAMVVVSGACRAAVCLVMAGDLHSLLLFPEAFTMLVLSKLYLVTKGSLVPLLAGTNPDSATAGGAAAPAGAVPGASASVPRAPHEELATLNARLGLLASLAGFCAAIPAVTVLKLGGAPWVLRIDFLVFGAGAVAALRLPIRKAMAAGRGRGAAGLSHKEDHGQPWRPGGPLDALGVSAAMHPEVTLAVSAMSVLRGVVGFLEFLLAFGLRRMHAATWWYGVMLAGSGAGALIGVLLVPRLRRILTEQQMLAFAVWLVALTGAVAGAVGGIPVQAAVALVLGLAASASKPAFDALAQRYVPTAAQGRAFARFETRLQLVWVVGSLIPVVANLPLGAGDIVIAAVAGVAGVSYLTGRRALLHRGPPGAMGTR